MTFPVVARSLVAVWLMLTVMACDEQPPPVIHPRSETPTAIAPLAAAKPSGTEAPHDGSGAVAPPANAASAPAEPLCDQEWSAQKGAKLPWPQGVATAEGQPVWVNFWAGWCKPCMAELPDMVKQAEAGGFVLLAISLDDDAREYRRALTKLAVSPKGAHLRFTMLGEAERAAWFRSAKLNAPAQLPAHLAVDSNSVQRCLRRGAVDGPVLNDFRDYVAALR